MTIRTAQLFQAVNAPEQHDGDVISFEANSEISLEESRVAVDAAAGDIAEHEQRANSLDEVSTALTDIALSMESTLTAGGMYPQTALFANLAIENQLARVGLNGEPVISVEDVGGALTRVEATEKSVDGIKSKLKKLWDALVEMVERVWDSIISFLRNFFTATGRLRERARRLAEDAHSTTITGKAPDKINIGAMAKNISVEGKTDYPFADAVIDLSKTLHDLAERSIARGKLQGAALSDLLRRQAKALFEQSQMYHIHVGKFTPPPQFKVIETDVHLTRSHGLQYAASYESPVFPGERVLRIVVAKADLGNAQYYAKYPERWFPDMNRAIGTDQYRIIRQTPDNEPSSVIRALSLREIEDLGNAVVDAAELFERFTREATHIQSQARADLRTVALQVTGEHGVKVISGNGIVFNTMLNAYGRVARNLLLPSTTLCSLVLAVCGDFVKLGERSLKEYQPA